MGIYYFWPAFLGSCSSHNVLTLCNSCWLIFVIGLFTVETQSSAPSSIPSETILCLGISQILWAQYFRNTLRYFWELNLTNSLKGELVRFRWSNICFTLFWGCTTAGSTNWSPTFLLCMYPTSYINHYFYYFLSQNKKKSTQPNWFYLCYGLWN